MLNEKLNDISVTMPSGSDDALAGKNGVTTGHWKSPLFGCTDSLVPNG